MRDILFLSHNIRHQRCEYLVKDLMKELRVLAPYSALETSSRLSASFRSASNIFNLGMSALRCDSYIHLDGIDVFIQPFLLAKVFLHDYHVPLVTELKWLGLHGVASVAHALLPRSLRQAKVIISPNMPMLRHASQYARMEDYYIIPNYPPLEFLSNIGKNEARRLLNLPEDNDIALFVGGARLKAIYGIDLLIHSWFEVKRKIDNANLYILGPTHELGLDSWILKNLRRRGIILPGHVDHSDVPTWIAASDLCLSQRTPGFPSEFYNIHDSIKLSEYALFEKPIVAAGYLPGKDYIHAETDVDSYSRAILSGFNGEAPKPTPHTWEENLPNIRKAYSALMDG